MVYATRAVDNRHEWLQRQRQKRVDRCEELTAITHCLQQQVSRCLTEQRQLLQHAITRRGVRALRSLHDGKGKDNQRQGGA